VREPRARRTPLEGGGDPRERRTSLEGGGDPRARRTPLDGGASARARRTSFEGDSCPRARRTSLEGTLCWAASVDRGSHHGVDRVVCVFCISLEVGFAFCVFLQVLSRIPPGFLGPSWLSPTPETRVLDGFYPIRRRVWNYIFTCGYINVQHHVPIG
jgi:hypothetical protein